MRATDLVWGDPDQVGRALAARAAAPAGLATAGDEARARARFADALLAHAAAAGDGGRRLVIVLEAGADDERAVAFERAVLAAAPPLLLIRFATTAAGVPGARDLDVAPLDAEATAAVASSMLGRPVDPRWAGELARATGGLPRLIVEAVRAAALADEDPQKVRPSSLVDATRGADQALAELVVRRAAALPVERAAVLEALAVLDGGGASVDAVAAVLEVDPAAVERAAAPLLGAGFLTAAGDRLTLPSPAHGRVLHEAIPAARRVALHRLAAAWHQEHGADAPALARHLLETGPAARAVTACREAAAVLARRGSPAAARALLERAADKVSGSAAAEVALELAALSVALGDYPAAATQAEKAARSRGHALRRRARLMLARARQKSGDLDSAQSVLAPMYGETPDDGEVAGAYARVLVARGRYTEAADVAGELPAGDTLDGGAAVRLESAGLAALYRGDPAAAAATFAELERRAGLAGDRALAGRALGLAGLAAHARGDIATAATLYERAAENARAAADVHAAAVYELNRATAHAERGRHGAALDALEAALAALQRLGDVPELAAALYNRGVELLMVGEVDAAARAAERALQIARAHGTPQMQLYARLLQGDVARRTGDRAAAAAAYRDALAAAGAEGPAARERLVARINLGEVLAEAGDRAGVDALDEAAADARSADDRDRLVTARARALLALAMDATALVADLDEARTRMRATGRVNQAWRADVVAARAAHAAGDDARARAIADESRALWDQLVADTPEVRRAGLARDPDARALAALGAELSGANARAAAAPVAAGVERDLRRLLALSRRLNSELRLAPLLDQVIDTVIEMTSAERGFLLLGDAGGELAITVARNFEQTALAGEELGLSRSIAERAATTGEVVLTVDAAFDERFGAAESVAAMRLRSVLAVPLRQKDRLIGTIYVDHRFRSGAFDDAAIELTRELADIAAVAIDNARLAEDNQRRQREIAALNRRLEAEVVEKEAELATVRARLPADAGNLRHDYDGIIGRSPAMLDLLRLLDRAADTALPVVIQGESGTGKELVARALHDNGPRRSGPFVAVNCGAMPETLLESELFGHVRGAFTGADRDRRGLFEVASGGTLLLDEVADTSLAMQSKLLRVLQEGEIRRVGDTRTRPVDVRVVAATNRPLDQLVASGELREDLFYRLSVIRVDVPPLRDRLEDLPALAAHILSRLADPPPRLTRAAVARLAGHGWPGNVRELENELARASALAGEVIDVADLSPRIATATPAAADPAKAENLELKPQVEALERALVEEAMGRTDGNQTAAAKLLGLSRYGLQKKLKRYGLAGTTA